nr:hypothetical protein GCM10025699_76860 [Microbacterium flavescens]
MTTTTTTAAASRDWTVWTTTARLVVTDAAMLDRASSIADEITDRVAAACDRFSTESELSRLADRLPEGVVVSELLLALLVGSALDAAEMSAGDVDPTLGAELADLGLAAGDDTVEHGRAGGRHPHRASPSRPGGTGATSGGRCDCAGAS